MDRLIERRQFLQLAAAGALGFALPGCSRSPAPGRYTAADAAALERQRKFELSASGSGPYGVHRYVGYRGLAELPWFEIGRDGRLRCVADDFPPAIDFHCHLGMSMLFAPDIDLQASSPRVVHHLDCDDDGDGGPCELDLDIYINGNFTPDALSRLRWDTVAQALWGSGPAATQTIPNLLREMDALRVDQCVVLPIAFNFPFGDDLADRWSVAIQEADAAGRLLMGASVHPRDSDRIASLERQAASGARVVKLHPTVQRFYPDDPDLMNLYAACERLGMIVFFHGGRAGIEPESSHRYAMPRHYEEAVSSFPKLPFVFGHGGARDAAAMLEMGLRHENAWFGIHGQGLTWLDEMIRRSGGRRLLFGSDWPWYHLAATLAKVLIVTENDPVIRAAILRTNAERLLA